MKIKPQTGSHQKQEQRATHFQEQKRKWVFLPYHFISYSLFCFSFLKDKAYGKKKKNRTGCMICGWDINTGAGMTAIDSSLYRGDVLLS